MKGLAGRTCCYRGLVRSAHSLSVSGQIAQSLTLLVGLVLTVAPSARAVSAAEPQRDCRLRQLASIAVDYSADASPTIPIVIQDHAVRAWLNTASVYSMIDQEAIEQLGLKARALGAGTPEITWGNKRINSYAIIPAISLGNARFKETAMLLLPTRAITVNGEGPIDGAPIAYLGMDVLTRVDIELDFGHNKMNVFSPDHCPGEVVYWADHYDVVPMRRGALKDLYFVMELNGKKLQTQLATGDRSSTIYANVASKLYGWDENPLGLQTMTAENGSSGGHRTMALTAGGLSILNAQIDLRTATTCVRAARITTDHDGALGFDGCMGASPLHLGMNVLTKLRIYLSANEQKMYFTATDAHKETSVSSVQMMQTPAN